MTLFTTLLLLTQPSSHSVPLSVYTDLSGCRPLPALEQPRSPGLTCPGVGGYAIRISRDDNTARSLRVDRFPDWGTSFVADVSTDFPALTLKQLKLEWRLNGGVPVALVVKLYNRYRVVGLGTRKNCLWKEVALSLPDAYARALALADRGCGETR